MKKKIVDFDVKELDNISPYAAIMIFCSRAIASGWTKEDVDRTIAGLAKTNKDYQIVIDKLKSFCKKSKKATKG